MSFRSMRVNPSASSGKRYVEFTVEQKSPSAGLYVGIDAGSNNYVSPRAIGIGESTVYAGTASYKSSGFIFSRTSSLNTGTTGIPVSSIVEGDVVSMLVNFDDGQLIFWKNGASQHTIPYPVATPCIPVVSLGAGTRVTINLSQSSPFVYNAPVGYTDWSGNPI